MLYAPRVARSVAIVAAAYMLYYVVWRTMSTLNTRALVFSLVVLAAEVQGLINFLLFLLMTWDTKRRPPFRLQPGLRVDIFVPTYNEDIDILEATLVGCNGVTYPHITYLLDDGHRTAMKELALRLGCRYLSRPDNQHAKAGNLNRALQHTDGEFIVVLDADTVPQPDYLDKTLGYFMDERVALVQLPQEFYNQDSMQHVRNADWHEQVLFYRVIQPGKNRWNAAFWCGSPSVVRRVALVDVGGVATETITEDIHTSLRLHARGWKTVYHDEALAYGIAPQTFSAFALQRLRWAQGTMQLLRSRENPLIIRGLTLGQRLNYLGSMGTYFDCVEKLILFVTPALILITGVLPLHVSAAGFLLHWLPYILLGTLANVALGRGEFRYLRVERYNLLKMFTFLRASLTLFWPRHLHFKVTPKRTDATVYGKERRQLAPQFGLMGLIGFAAGVALLNLRWGLTASYQRPDIVVMTLVWAVADIGILMFGVRDVLRRLHARQSYRFPATVAAEVVDAQGEVLSARTTKLSRYGASIELAPGASPIGDVSLTLALPDGPVTLPAVIVRDRQLREGPGLPRAMAEGSDGTSACSSRGAHSWRPLEDSLGSARTGYRVAFCELCGTAGSPERHELGMRFLELQPEDQRRLVEYLFVTMPRRGVPAPPIPMPRQEPVAA